LNYKKELTEVKKLIKSNDIEIVITDSYDLDQNYLSELKKVTNKLVSLHDFVPYSFPSDIVVNGNIYASQLNYKSMTNDTDFLLGPKYTLMREEFQDVSRNNTNSDVNSILITVGGSDKLNLTPKIIAAIDQLEDKLHLDVVVGLGFDNLAQIIEVSQNCNLELSLHFNVDKMSQLMLKSDLAISAGGSTLYELAATGTPTITLLQADNQVKVTEAMEAKDAIINLGFGNQVTKKELKNNVKKLINDFALRKEMSQQGPKIIDGEGAKRVANYILNN
jgi:UDP-2,4-diacetamido-2,4,6-trideoxy-beta-L-altropyranose hydrolase